MDKHNKSQVTRKRNPDRCHRRRGNRLLRERWQLI